MTAPLLSRSMSLARRHWLLLIAIGVGSVLRLVCWLAYQPALLSIDSFGYLRNLDTLRMDGFSPIGYELILTGLLAIGRPFGAGLAMVAAVQHLVGLIIAIMLYGIARRLGARRWVSALITVPVLTDGYQLQIEQSVMAETWSALVLVGAVALLLARRPRNGATQVPAGPSWRVAAVAGVLLAVGATLRSINVVALAPFVAFLIFTGAHWKDRAWRRRMLIRTVAGIAGFATLFGLYLVAFRADTGRWGFTGGWATSVVYGRAATIAECERLDLDRYLAQLCPAVPKEDRAGIDSYTHDRRYRLIDLPPGTDLAELRNEFGWMVVRAQPLEFTATIVRDFGKGFAWSRERSSGDVPLYRWQFQIDYPRWEATDANELTQRYDRRDPRAVPVLTDFLRTYQLGAGYTPGTILGLAGLLGLAALVVRRAHLQTATVLVTGIGFVLLFGAAVFEFSWRYQLPGLVFFPLAAAIGFTAITSPRRPEHPPAMTASSSGSDAPPSDPDTRRPKDTVPIG